MEASGQEPPEQPDAEPDARTRLMQEVAEQMDAIEAEYGDHFEIGRVITVVEVKAGETIEVRVRAGQFPWVTLGMLEWAKKTVEAMTAQGGGPSE